MGLRIAAEILQEISFHVVDRQLLQGNQLGTAVAGGPQTIPFGSPLASLVIYTGAQLICGTGNDTEVITVTGVTTTTFTATFANPHPATDPLWGATFPACQADSAPIWRQSSVLDFLGDAQNDFLQDVHPIYNTATVNVLIGKSIYPWPADALWIDRVMIEGLPLWNVSQYDSDTDDAAWETEAGVPLPTKWYMDNLGNQLFGMQPLAEVNDTAVLWYPQKAARALGLLSTFLVPDVMLHFVKYRAMQRMFEVDGEQRDPARAEYCRKRYELGVKISKRFVDGMDTALKTQQAPVPQQ